MATSIILAQNFYSNQIIQSCKTCSNEQNSRCEANFTWISSERTMEPWNRKSSKISAQEQKRSQFLAKNRIVPSISTIGLSTLIFSNAMAAKLRESLAEWKSRKPKPWAPPKARRRRKEDGEHGRRRDLEEVRVKVRERSVVWRAKEVMAVQGARSMVRIATCECGGRERGASLSVGEAWVAGTV